MDILGRGLEDGHEVLRALADRVRSALHVVVPVQVSKDSDGHVVQLQPLIKAVRRNADGTQEQVNFPSIPEAPISFASGGGVSSTFPVKEKDYGFVVINSRSIDTYQQNGGLQHQADARTHDLSDAMYMPGLKPDPSRLKDHNTEAQEHRSDDGQHRTITHPKNGVKVTVNGGRSILDINAKTSQVEMKAKTIALAAGDAKAGRGANTENTVDRDLNEKLKGLSARVGQVEKTAHALFDVTSRLRQLTQIRVPEVAQLAGLLNQAPGGLDAIVGAIEGKAQAYAQTQLQQALGMFLNPSIGGLASLLGGGIEGQIQALQAQINKLIFDNPILASVDALERQIEAVKARDAKPEVEAAQLQPVQDALAQIAKDNPAVGILRDLQKQLAGLASAAGPGLNFMEPQKQLAQGNIRSIRLSEGG